MHKDTHKHARNGQLKSEDFQPKQQSGRYKIKTICVAMLVVHVYNPRTLGAEVEIS